MHENPYFGLNDIVNEIYPILYIRENNISASLFFAVSVYLSSIVPRIAKNTLRVPIQNYAAETLALSDNLASSWREIKKRWWEWERAR